MIVGMGFQSRTGNKVGRMAQIAVRKDRNFHLRAPAQDQAELFRQRLLPVAGKGIKADGFPDP